MQYLFTAVALAFLLLVIGWPLWLFIWAIRQKKQHGKFPWQKVILIALLCIVLLGLLQILSLRVLNNMKKNYGVEFIDEITTKNTIDTIGGDVKDMK